jgi:hypothetical protein
MIASNIPGEGCLRSGYIKPSDTDPFRIQSFSSYKLQLAFMQVFKTFPGATEYDFL